MLIYDFLEYMPLCCTLNVSITIMKFWGASFGETVAGIPGSPAFLPFSDGRDAIGERKPCNHVVSSQKVEKIVKWLAGDMSSG